MNTRLARMIENNLIPFEGGVWIDCYNQSTNVDCAGTIIAGINSKNLYFVTDMKDEREPRQNRDNSERSVLGWTRDKRGNIVDRHVVVVANSVTATKRDNTQNYVVEKVAQIHPGQNGAVYSPDGISPTICAGEGIKTQTKIIQRPRGFNKGNIFSECPTITKNQWQENNMLINGLRIRKFTPRECFRLMGVRDQDIDKIQAAGISRTQQCHLAGNSIVVNCIAAVLKNLIEL